MKAKIVSVKIYEGVIDYTHGGGHFIKRLVLEKQNELGEWELLTITPHGDHVYVAKITPEEFDEISSPLEEIVEVPDVLVEQILKADAEQKQLYRRVSNILS